MSKRLRRTTRGNMPESVDEVHRTVQADLRSGLDWASSYCSARVARPGPISGETLLRKKPLLAAAGLACSALLLATPLSASATPKVPTPKPRLGRSGGTVQHRLQGLQSVRRGRRPEPSRPGPARRHPEAHRRPTRPARRGWHSPRTVATWLTPPQRAAPGRGRCSRRRLLPAA